MTQALRDDPVRGLATVALLKAEFDAGCDYLGMFMPFVYDSIALYENGFRLTELQETILSRHRLPIPSGIMMTLLSRAVRAKVVTPPSGGFYSPGIKPLEDADLEPRRRQIEREQASVAAGLRDFAQTTTGTELGSDEDCLTLLLQFFEQFHVTILIGEQDTSFSEMVHDNRLPLVLVAKFLDTIYRQDPERTLYVGRMLEGFVLQNALLLKDISIARRRFLDLEVFLDTGLALQMLGHEGEAQALAARDLLALLKETNAKVSIFERTVEEIERILLVYQRHLGSREGIATLRPTELTFHFVRNHYKPSDVAVAMSLLRHDLADLGIHVRRFPPRDPRYTLGEAQLTACLMRPTDSELDPRVTHDVDSIAAILTIRRGRPISSLDSAYAIFATSSLKVIRNVTRWFRESGEHGVPPIMDSLALSNTAWLKKPKAAKDLKLHELVALCSAALAPTKKVWKAFTSELRTLERNSIISTDERIAIVVESLITNRLAEYDEVDATSVAQIVETVLQSQGELEKQALASEAAKTDAELRAKEERERLLKDHEVTRRALASALAEAERKRHGIIRIEHRLQLGAKFVSNAVFALLAITVLVSVWELPIPLVPSWVKKAVAFVMAAVSYFHLVWGVHLSHLRAMLASRVESILRWLLHFDVPSDFASEEASGELTDYPLRSNRTEPGPEGEDSIKDGRR